jgi:hypothetical protein
MKNIVWKDISGYEGIYQISNTGEVKRLSSYDSRGHLRKERILKKQISITGYYQIGLHINGKETKYLIHQLVGKAFLKNSKNYTEINHKDENPKNNLVSNLEWCSRKYNVNYGNAQIKRVKSRYEKEEELNYA